MKNSRLLISILALSLLAGCQSVKKELGVGRNSPDEFSVVKRAPLTLPPDYSLRAPGGGAPPASEVSEQAKTLLLGESTKAAPVGGADDILMQKMKVQSADPAIREVIDSENGYIALQNQSLSEKLIFWKDEAPSDARVPASVVDPKAEAERLKKNKEEGKPVNDGKVPVIEKKESTIDKLFGPKEAQ